MYRKLILLVFFTLISVTSLFSENIPQDRLTLEGKIMIKGNEPHSFVALTTKKGEEYQLQGSLVKNLRQRYQGMVLKLSGTLMDKKKHYGRPIRFNVEEIK